MTLVFQLASNLCHTGIGDTLTKLQGRLHTFYVQVLNHNNVLVFNETGSELVDEILSLIGDIHMLTSYLETSLSPVLGAFLLLGETTLKLLQPCLSCSE